MAAAHGAIARGVDLAITTGSADPAIADAA